MKRRPLATVLCIAFTVGAYSVPALGQVGKTLYDQKCGRCHAVYDPGDYSAGDWAGIVRSMKAQAALTAQEISELIEYLENESGKDPGTSHSQRPVLGGYLYTEYFQTPEETKNFDIHYLAMYVSGWANDDIYYFGEFELEHGGKGDNTFVEQAYIDYWVRPNIAVKVGAMLTPFNRFDEMHDPLTNYIITRPQVSREIGVSAWKDVGVDLHGYVNINEQASLSFDVYSINGLGSGANLRGSRQYRDNNEDKAFGGRLNVMYRDVLEVGGSTYHGAWDADGRYNLTMLGGHVMLHTAIADLYGEVAKATSENAPPTDDGDMSGYFIQGSRLFRSRYRPTVRFGSLDYLDRGDLFGRSIGKGDKDLNELALAFSYYPTSRVALKAEYTLFREGDRAAEKDNDQLGLQAAVKF